jgi:hypothetical protein
MRGTVIAVLALLGIVLLSGAAHAQADPQQFCRRAGTDDTLRSIPPSLVPRAQSMFGPSMPSDMAQRTTVFRCMRGLTLMCNTGANLPCGKADTRRTNRGASAWCKDNPNSDFIPMYAVGHDTIYQWRCTDGQARIVSQQDQVDERGFITRYWRPLN